MRAWIVGAGAVGLGLASALLAGGARVGLVARTETRRALRRKGLRKSGLFGERLHPPESFALAAEIAAIPAPADFLVVATKSFDSEPVADALAGSAVLGQDTQVVLFQNGWGNEEPFVARLPRERVWSARVITGFRRPEPQHVEITVHAEPIRVGSLFGEPAERVRPLCDCVAAGGLPCEPTDRIAHDLWAKLLYNGVLNPLGAICDVRYGALAAHPATRETLGALAREIFAVMRAAGHATHWPDAAAYLEDFHARLLPPTAAHESSMLQDLRAGRRTEIDALTGAVVRLGEAHGIETPVNRTLLSLVRFLEDHRRVAGANRLD